MTTIHHPSLDIEASTKTAACMTEKLHLISLDLRFTRDVQFHALHQLAVCGWLLDRIDRHPTPPGIALYAPESGRVRYRRGDPYRVAFALAEGGEFGPHRLAECLAKPPRREYGKMPGAPFGNTYTIERVTDLLTNRPLSIRPSALSSESLREWVERLAAETEIVLRFISPLCILRTPVTRKSHILDEHVFEPGRVLAAVAESMAEWMPHLALPPILRDRAGVPWPDRDVRVVANRLVRADTAYPNNAIMGSAGRVTLHFEGGVGDWAESLLLAGFVGVGKARAMGQGRFVVEGFQPVPAWPPPAARSILDRAAEPENLKAAIEAMRDAGRAPGVDGIDLDRFIDDAPANLAPSVTALRLGPGADPLRGVLIESVAKDTGRRKWRGLAVPTLRDRFMQRAVYQVLEPVVESFLEDSSFAYRRGLSHRTAVRGVDRARKEGYTHVLDADIRAFFDRVDWGKLQDRLEVLFGSDPVVAALMEWMRAPVEFEGRTVLRDRGLPQGAVVSPLLANLYLDQFDEAIAEAGLRMVRYADDFVIVAKNPKDIERAREIVEAELAKLGLELNLDKTAATTFDQGFTFLGALFCRSMVMQRSPGQKVETAWDRRPGPPADGEAPAVAEGWLATFLSDAPTLEPVPEERFEPPVTRPGPEARPLIVLARDAKLVARRNGLLLTKDGGPGRLVPWREISEIVLIGGRYLPAPLIQRTMHKRIPIAMHKANGDPMGLILPDRVASPSPVARRQWEWGRDATRPMAVARELIVAKIRNTRFFARRFDDDGDLARMLKRLQDEASNAESPVRLRGIEGQAAHAWFSRWPAILKPPFDDYPGRTTRGAQDPVNAMLNLLYSHLFRLTHTTILMTGLDPYEGVFHEGRGRYAALAADLMEPFRFLADRVVIAAINRGQIEADDFRYSEKGRYPCLVGDAGVRVLFEEWEKALARPVHDVTDHLRTPRDHLYHQAMLLRKTITGDIDVFLPFRIKT
ncbi:MAG: CRISPR-associated endonuclease Cas1 [Deltaproteobacteria bacterium]|nr:CRISPR-associated endonuclease Cas1 [Deltaproteobacteria bacterium]